MATHYTANKLKCDEIHMYGFDSIFSFDITSSTDLYLPSDRDNMNTERLTRNWRPIWTYMFQEFKDTQFIIHNRTTDTKLIKLSKNVEVRKGVK
jgi:hypothetical protein